MRIPLLILVSLLTANGMAASHDGLKRRIAVMDMALTATTLSQTSPGSYSQTTSIQIPPPADFALGLTEMLTTALTETGAFIVLERKGLSDATAEQDLGGSERANREVATTAGSVIGAQALVRCAVTEYAYTQSGGTGSLKIVQGLSLGATSVRAQVGIDVRIYDARTTQVLASTVARGSATARSLDVKYANRSGDYGGSGFAATPLGQASRQAIEKAVAFLVEKVATLPWEARVIRAQDDQVYINAGAEGGVAAGEEFKVFRSGEALIDPASGLNLGSPDREIGLLRIVAVQPKYAVGEVIRGELPQRNDVIRPASSPAIP